MHRVFADELGGKLMGATAEPLREHPLSPDRSRAIVIAETFERMRSQSGMTVLIDGLAGMGKTFLLRSLVSAASSTDGLRVTFVRADEIEAGEPYSFIERFVASLSIPDWNFVPDEHTTPVALARECVLRLVSQTDAPARLIAIDDAQWIDEESQRVLRYLIPRVTRRGVTLAFGVRTPHLHDSFGDFLLRITTEHPEDLHIRVEPFTRQEVAELTRERLGVGISSHTAQQLLDATDGSFFAIESMLGSLSESELTKLSLGWVEPGAAVATRSDPLLHQYVRLTEAGQRAAEIVCLAGHEVTPKELADAGTLLGEAIDADEAVREHVLAASGFGSSIMPRHALLAQALVDTLSAERARAVHLALAEVTSGYRSLRHTLLGASEWNGQLRERVAEFVHAQSQRGTHTLSAEVLRAALDLAVEIDDRAELIEWLGLVHMRTKTGYLMLDLLPEVEALPYSVLREFIAIVLAAHKVGERLPMERVQRLLMTPAASAEDRVVIGFFAFMVVILTMRSPDREAVPPLIGHAKHLIAQGPATPAELTDRRLDWLVDRDGYLLVLDAYLMVQDQVASRFDLVRDALPELTERVHALPDSAMKVDAAVAVAGAKHAIGDVAGARELAQHGVDLIGRVMEPWAASTARLILADCYVLQGDYGEAVELMNDTEDLSYTSLDVETRSNWAALRVFIAAVMGQPHAEAHIDQARRQKEVSWEGYGPDLFLVAECELGRVRGDHAAILEASADGWAEQLANTRHGYLTYRAHALISTGQCDAAATLIDQLAKWRGVRWHEYWGTVDWLRARLAAALGDAGTAKWHYEAAAAEQSFPLPWSLTLADYGEFLIAEHEPAAAAEVLQRSVLMLENLGAHGYLPRVRALLDSLGHEQAPGASRAHLLDALTAREQQIVDHLVKGRSNNQIAESLVVSVTTVRSHVSNVLRKLNLSSRGEVARHFRERA